MKEGKEKYDRLLSVLRKSVPELQQKNEIADKVFRRIDERQHSERYSSLVDILFGWIYIGWVRRSLIGASFCLLAFFIWQQNQIISQIDELNAEIRNTRRISAYDPAAALEKRQVLLRMSKENSGSYIIQEEELSALIDSLNKLNIKYRDLLDLINNDPDLKNMVQEKLEKKMQSKIKL